MKVISSNQAGVQLIKGTHFGWCIKGVSGKLLHQGSEEYIRGVWNSRYNWKMERNETLGMWVTLHGVRP